MTQKNVLDAFLPFDSSTLEGQAVKPSALRGKAAQVYADFKHQFGKDNVQVTSSSIKGQDVIGIRGDAQDSETFEAVLPSGKVYEVSQPVDRD